LKYFEMAVKELLSGAERVIKSIDRESIEEFIRTLVEAREKRRKVFIVGSGRSGLVGKAFALRLMHLGFNTYVAGETIIPALRKGDIVVAISGSGMTKTVVALAETAKEIGVKVIAVTSHPDSKLGRIADQVVVIKGRTKVAEERNYEIRQLMGEHESLAPLGTMFEVSAMIFLDSVIAELMRRLGVTEEEMRRRHAVVE